MRIFFSVFVVVVWETQHHKYPLALNMLVASRILLRLLVRPEDSICAKFSGLMNNLRTDRRK